MDETIVIDSYAVPKSIRKKPIDRIQIQQAQMTLNRYKEGKTNLEKRIVENEQWYKLRHWECMRRTRKKQVEPTSGWLFNAIANKHADIMDNFPSPNVLPREEGDIAEAKMLSSILPVVLEQTDFEDVYDEVNDYKLKSGTGIYGVFWNGQKHNGLGDVEIRMVDIINLFWESGIKDIQRSENVFHVELQSNNALIDQYPELSGKLTGMPGEDVGSKYLYDDKVDTSNKSAVVDWYYKKRQNGRQVLHYCKYVGDTVLFATENEEEYAERGWYDHGLYPFIFDPLFRVAGSPCGFGYIDVAKSAQEYIDRGNQALLTNLLVNARPRFFIRTDGSVNEEEYADMTRDFVHVEGGLGEDSVRPVVGAGLNGNYIALINNKIDELKEVTGNRDISTGGTTSGVTAASAIAAMQEAGSKLSRDSSKSAYRAFRKICMMTIELIRQFYTMPRCFRIMGDGGKREFVDYSNKGLLPQNQGTEMGMDMGFRLPVFDVEITAQKASPYSRMSQNEMALQFYGAGFFNPQMADQALGCLDMMDFDQKRQVMESVSKAGSSYQQLMQLAQATLMDAQQGSSFAVQMAAQIVGGASMGMIPQGGRGIDHERIEADVGEASNTKKARQRVADSTSPT